MPRSCYPRGAAPWVVRDDGPVPGMVVDDEALYAQTIGREVGRQGIACDVAYSGREALQFVARQQYGVILLDHRLPDADGIRMIPQLLIKQAGEPS